MADKLLKTKIALKQNTYEYWTTGEGKDYIPLYGEVCLCEVSDTATATTAPTVLFKVGTAKRNADGSYVTGTAKKFSELNWVSALAADVYSWAKKTEADFIAWAKENIDTDTNTDTQYRFAIASGALEVYKTVYNMGVAGSETKVGTYDFLTSEEVGALIGKADITITATNGLTGGGTFNVNASSNDTLIIEHGAKPTSGSAQSATVGSGRTYVTKVLVDDYGHIAGVETATETDQTIPLETAITITDKTNTDTEDEVYAVTNLVEGGTKGHAITPTYTTVPTKAYVDKKVAAAAAGAVDYLGLVHSAEELVAAETEATHGDFVRVATAFGDYHVGDLLIYRKATGPTPHGSWDVIHGEEGDIISVTAGNGLTGGGDFGALTLNVGAGDGITVEADKVSAKAGNHIAVDANGIHHGAKPTTGTAQSATAGSGRTYVTEVLVDSYGHIAGVKTATESVTNTDTWRNINVFAGAEGSKASVSLKGTGIDTGALNLKAGTGLKWTATANNSDATVDIDETVTFILDCN